MVLKIDKKSLGTGKSIIEMTADEFASAIESGWINVDHFLIRFLKNKGTPFTINVLKSSSISADKAQEILYYLALNFKIIDVDGFDYLDFLFDIITYGASDVTLSATTTYSGIQRFRTLDLNGYQYIADGQPHVIIAYTIKDSGGTGAIVKTATGGAGGGPTGAANVGGNGGGGLIIIAKSVTANSITANGANGVRDDSTVGNYAGADGGSGSYIVVGSDSPGTGGAGGIGGGIDAGGGGGGNGGPGGTQSAGCSGGNGGSYTTITYNSYLDLAVDMLKAMCDWWLKNIAGKTPTSVKDFPNIGGAGGGEGGDYYDGTYPGNGGGGGGAGGQIIIVCDMISASTCTANGGDGASGYGSGGGGGGGGIVYVLYRTSASITTLAANGGSGAPGWNLGEAGTAGTAKAVAI